MFAKEGARVVVADIVDVNGEETVANIKTSGGDAIFAHTDVSLAAEVENLIKVTINTFGKIDILFNNAGIDQKPIELRTSMNHCGIAFMPSMLKVYFYAVKYAVPQMKKAGGGIIINTASMIWN